MTQVSINPDCWYRPSEIAKQGIILNSRNKSDVFFVLRLIKSNSLKAQNYGKGHIPYFRVLGRDLIDYKREHEGIEVNTSQ